MIRFPVLRSGGAGAARCPAATPAALGAFLSLVLLCACAPDGGGGRVQLASADPAPAATAARPAARFTATHFVAADGENLPLRQWLPVGPPRAVILALHGFNDYSSAFATPAALWAERGIATFAYDQRGFGATRNPGSWAGSAYLATDTVTAARILRARYPGVPLYLLGESMGGAVAVVTMTGAAATPVPEVDGIILSAPAVWGRDTMELLPKLMLWAGVRMFPTLVLTGRGLKIKASDNVAMLRELTRDPLVMKSTQVATVYGLVNLMDRALAAAPRLRLPTLLMYGAHDEIIPRLPIRSFVAHLPPDRAERVRLAFYRQGYHLLLRDLEGPLVAGDVASWVLDPARPLPSHADETRIVRPWPPPPQGTS